MCVYRSVSYRLYAGFLLHYIITAQRAAIFLCPRYPQLPSAFMAIVFKVCFETQQHKFKLSFLTLTPHLFDLKSILCLLLCQVPAQGVGISTAAVRVKYKCSNRPGGGISADTACVFVSTCV